MEEILLVVGFILKNAPTMEQYVSDLVNSWKRDHPMTDEENAKFDADIEAIKTDPDFVPGQHRAT